jgi:adenosylhomocysteine nucleosidase
VQSVGLVIAATGLAAEARIAERSKGVVAVAAGGDATRLASLIERGVAEGARGIISFGIAGGLRADLKSGGCVVGTSVVCGGHSYSADAAWTKRIAGCLPDAEFGAIAGCQSVVADPAAKKVLFDETGAIAADMESDVVARIAADRQLPFAILRVIADPAHQRLPPAAIHGLKPDGSPDILAVIKSLGSEPGQLPDLIRVAIAARRAMIELFRCHRLLGPGLGFTDLG